MSRPFLTGALGFSLTFVLALALPWVVAFPMAWAVALTVEHPSWRNAGINAALMTGAALLTYYLYHRS